MRTFRTCLIAFAVVASLTCLQNNRAWGQSSEPEPLPPPPHARQIHLKHVLVIGQTKGFEHDSVSAAMATIYNLGQQSGLWDTTLRTDTELLTKKDLGRNTKNLTYFDLIVFASTTGELEMDDSQKKDMMSFIHDDGKGFVGIHAALDTNYTWPEYGEMIGGWFDQHPWMTFEAPIALPPVPDSVRPGFSQPGNCGIDEWGRTHRCLAPSEPAAPGGEQAARSMFGDSHVVAFHER